MDSIIVEGQTYKIAHTFSDSRVIIDMGGVFAFADKNPSGTWDLSGLPARESEKSVLNDLLAPTLDQSILTVTPPEE
jgi:hypothetical protein